MYIISTKLELKLKKLNKRREVNTFNGVTDSHFRNVANV